jgi:hypothetical protein
VDETVHDGVDETVHDEPDKGGARTENGRDGARRWPRFSPLIAGVTAAVLIAGGGGGVYFATTGSDGGDGAGTKRAAPAPAKSSAAGEPAGPPELSVPPPGGRKGIAPGEPNPYGNVVYVPAGKLPAGPARAAVHELRKPVTAGAVARLAKALGLSGDPVRTGDVWRIGPERDAPGPVLTVAVNAPGDWSFRRFGGGGPRGDDCSPKADRCAGPGIAPGEPAPGGAAGEAVDAAGARKAAAPVLAAAGGGGSEIAVDGPAGGVRTVRAEPRIGGVPTHGWTTTVTVGPGGEVVGGWGRLAVPVRGADFPVLTADTALGKLNGSRSAAPAGAECLPGERKSARLPGCAATRCVPTGTRAKDGPHGEDGSVTAQCRPPCDDAANPTRSSDCPAFPVARRLVIGEAVLGLTAGRAAGRPALVPAWLFRVRAGAGEPGHTVVWQAVEPKRLASEPPPSPWTAPSPGRPRETGEAGDTRRIGAYTTAGRTLTAGFWGGVCSSYRLRAREDGDRVRVTVEESMEPGRACIALAKWLTESVALERPLGGRTVVDAASGLPVPRG